MPADNDSTYFLSTYAFTSPVAYKVLKSKLEIMFCIPIKKKLACPPKLVRIVLILLTFGLMFGSLHMHFG